jgi:hypothetical protein
VRKESFVHVEGNAPLLSCYLGIEAAAISLDSPRIICAVCACAHARVCVCVAADERAEVHCPGAGSEPPWRERMEQGPPRDLPHAQLLRERLSSTAPILGPHGIFVPQAEEGTDAHALT